MLLADAAQAIDNKLYVLGGGWSVIGPGPAPFAIALKLDVPWNETGRRHEWKLRLIDADANAVVMPTDEGPKPLEIGGEFEVGRPDGLTPGTPIDLSLAVGFGPMQLPPGQRLVWELTIDGLADEDWTLPFTTRPA